MKIVEGFRLREVMGQATIVGEGVGQINFSKLITLNPSASHLWKSIEGKVFTQEDLAALLVEKYGISTERAMADACSVVEQWMSNGIID